MADFNSLNRRDFVGTAGSAVVGAALAMNPSLAAAQSRRRYAIVGTGDRASGMWGRPIAQEYSDIVSNRLLSLLGDERSLYSQGVRDGNNTVSENWIMTFYPGVRDAGKATLIDLQEGAELRNIDFNLTRQTR